MDIKIGRSAHTCAECECDFVHEQGINSLVRVVEDQFVREDYCGNCWGEERGQGTYSSWHAQYYDPKAAEQAPAESFTPLRQTFYEAVEETTREGLSVAYLAAQLLRRQKVFRFIKETKDPDTDAATILFNDRIGNRLIEVSDPNLSHAELEHARVRLMESLAKLEAPEEEAEPETEESTEVIEDSTTDETETDRTETDETMEDETDATKQDIAQV
jgi:hypothetical protein